MVTAVFCLLLGRKTVNNLDSILKSRDIILSTKVCLVRAMVFLVVMYRCDSWTIKKADHWRIDAFEVWCWRRLLRVPWTTRRSNQSILKETSPEYSLAGLWWSWSSSSLATWFEELTHWKRPGCWARLKAGGERDDRGWDGWMASLTQWTWVWASSRNWWWTRKPGVLQSMGSQRVRHGWVAFTFTIHFLILALFRGNSPFEHVPSLACSWNTLFKLLCLCTTLVYSFIFGVIGSHQCARH